MRKICLLFAFCVIGLIVQAGTYMTGVNQLERLVQAVQDENGNPLAGLSQLEYESNGNVKGDQSHWYLGKPQAVNLETDVPLFGFSWGAASYTSYYPSGDNQYRALLAINWAGKGYVQKSGIAINLNQDDMTVDASANVKEKNDLSALATIDFSGNYLRDISLDGLGALTSVNLSNNPTLKLLSINNCAVLASVDITNSGLRLSTLYAITQTVTPVSALTYIPQGTVELSFPADKVDLSADIVLGETASVITWTGAEPINENNGLFEFAASLAGTTITAEVSNSALGSEIFTYSIALTEAIGDREQYKVTSKVNNSDFGSISPADEEKLYVEGAGIIYTLTPKTGCELLKLTVNGTDKTAEVIDGVYTVTSLSEDLTIIASFRPAGQNYFLTMPPLPYPEMPGLGNIPYTTALFDPVTHTVSHFPVHIEDAAKFMTVRPGNNVGDIAIGTHPEVAGVGKWHVIGYDICLLDGSNSLKPGYYDLTYEWNDEDNSYWIKDTYVSLFPFTVNVDVSATGWTGDIYVHVAGETQRSFKMTPLEYSGWYAYTFENEPTWVNLYFTNGNTGTEEDVSAGLEQVFMNRCVAILADRTITDVNCPDSQPDAIANSTFSGVMVSPNPTAGRLQIQTEKPVSVLVYDYTGRLVKTSVTDSEIDITACPSGFYLLKIENQYVKIIKK